MMSIGLKRGAVVLEPHCGEWEVRAAETIKSLKEIWGDAAVDIQHVGSTAVLGIAAKPIIDIVVGVENFADILARREELAKAGIIFRGEDVAEQLLFAMGDFERDTRTHHIHVVKWNGRAWRDYIQFRDYLNTDREAAFAYEELKRELAKAYPKDRVRYTNGKQGLVRELLKRAEKYLGKERGDSS